MMKRPLFTLSFVAMLLGACAAPVNASATAALAAPFASTQAASAPTLIADPPPDVVPANDEDYTSTDGPVLRPARDLVQPGELTATEAAALRYMREEEKLAHDVYLVLYSQWQLSIFQNIANSEQTHMDAVKVLLDRYGLEDPATAEVGIFTNGELQDLYDQLIKQGSQSLAEALKVGAAIEEIDILDLEQRIAQTDNPDIVLVYEHLAKGSHNHLRAFVSTLESRTGETYQPQYLSQDAYQVIVGTPVESGARAHQGGPGGKGYGRP
jgi:hypothetical protein